MHRNDARPLRAFWCLFDDKRGAGQSKVPVCLDECSKQQPRSRYEHLIRLQEYGRTSDAIAAYQKGDGNLKSGRPATEDLVE